MSRLTSTHYPTAIILAMDDNTTVDATNEYLIILTTCPKLIIEEDTPSCIRESRSAFTKKQNNDKTG